MTTPPNIAPQKLSWKRFIPLIVLVAGGLTVYFNKTWTKYSVCCIMNIVESPNRIDIIMFIGAIVGILHYYYVGRHNKTQNQSDMMRWVNGLFSSFATAIGYAYMLNSGLNFAAGLVNEYYLGKAFFVDKSQVDAVAVIIVTAFITYIPIHLMWKLIKDFIFEIKTPSTEATAVSNPQASLNLQNSDEPKP